MQYRDQWRSFVSRLMKLRDLYKEVQWSLQTLRFFATLLASGCKENAYILYKSITLPDTTLYKVYHGELMFLEITVYSFLPAVHPISLIPLFLPNYCNFLTLERLSMMYLNTS